jgi:hypothetical protein
MKPLGTPPLLGPRVLEPRRPSLLGTQHLRGDAVGPLIAEQQGDQFVRTGGLDRAVALTGNHRSELPRGEVLIREQHPSNKPPVRT